MIGKIMFTSASCETASLSTGNLRIFSDKLGSSKEIRDHAMTLVDMVAASIQTLSAHSVKSQSSLEASLDYVGMVILIEKVHVSQK